MVRTYADYDFYLKKYLNLKEGDEARIQHADFSSCAMKATRKIRHRTNENIDENLPISEEVKMCCCELAEKFYSFDQIKDDNGRILQSYSNDGDSGTFKADDMTEKALNESLDIIVREWLSGTGLLFCGVRKR